MTTEEFAEFLLAHLYELAEEAPHPNFLFSVDSVLSRFGIAGGEEVQKALNYLEERRFVILASYDRIGGMSAALTIEGSLFVEKGGETGMIERCHKPPQMLSKAYSVSSPSPVSQEGTGTAKEEGKDLMFARRAVEALLEDVEDVLKKDDTMAVELKRDLLSDIATFKIQVDRNIKNRQIIGVLLSNLSRIPAIAPLVSGLSHIVDIYFR